MNTLQSETSDSRWKSLYVVGGATALVSVLLVVLDIFVSIWLPGGEVAPGARSATDWFALFQSNMYYGFRDLGFLNILNIVLGVPVFLALYAAHRHDNAAYAALALVLFVLGGAVYISNNTVLPMLALSEKHALAATDAQRAVFAAAGEAILARGADFTLGSLIGFLLPSIAQIAMSLVMLRGGIFGRATAYSGVVGFACLLIFTVWTTLVPEAFDTAMLLALPGGLFVIAWNILVARRLFQLGRGVAAPVLSYR
jgi:hypothetical protein